MRTRLVMMGDDTSDGQDCLSGASRRELRKALARDLADPTSHRLLRNCLLLLLDSGLGKKELGEIFGLSQRLLDMRLTSVEWPVEDEASGLPTPTEVEASGTQPGDQSTVSMREVAAAAGVSLSTASLALRGRPGVSLKTRSHVRTVAEKMGYKPHPYVSSLMQQVGRRRRAKAKVNLAWLLYGPHSVQSDFKRLWGNYPTYAAALKRARELGYEGLEPYWIGEPGVSLEQVARVLKSRGIQGALVGSGSSKLPKLREFSDISLIKLTTPFVNSLNHHVFPDAYQGVFLACTKLWQAGYRRIGFSHGMTLSQVYVGSAEAAWTNFQNALPEELRIPPFLGDAYAAMIFDSFILNRRASDYIRTPFKWNEEGSKEKLEEIRQAYLDGKCGEAETRSTLELMLTKQWVETNRPDAIIGNHSQLVDKVRQFGYRVPEDIGIIHLNLKADTPDWTGVNQHWDTIGRIAVDTLHQLIGMGEIGSTPNPVLRSVAGSWVEGKTTCERKPPVYPRDRYVDRWIRERLNAQDA